MGKKHSTKKMFWTGIIVSMLLMMLGMTAMAEEEVNYGENWDLAYIEIDGVTYGCDFDFKDWENRKPGSVSIQHISTDKKEVKIPETITYNGYEFWVETVTENYFVVEGGEVEYEGFPARDTIETLILPKRLRYLNIYGDKWKNLKKIVAPASMRNLLVGGSIKAKIELEPGCKRFQVKGNGIYKNKGRMLTAVFGTKKNFKIPKGTVTIARSAFRNNDVVEKVTMPNTVKFIEGTDVLEEAKDFGVFYGCKNLKTVVCSSNLEQIGKNAFVNCRSLSKVYINNKKKAPKIDKTAFAKTKKGIRFYVKNETVKKELDKQLRLTKAKGYRILVSGR